MNPAPAHLESKLRFFWDLSVVQIAAAFVGIMLGFTWAKFGPLGRDGRCAQRHVHRRDAGDPGVRGQPDRLRPARPAGRCAALAAAGRPLRARRRRTGDTATCCSQAASRAATAAGAA